MISRDGSALRLRLVGLRVAWAQPDGDRMGMMWANCHVEKRGAGATLRHIHTYMYSIMIIHIYIYGNPPKTPYRWMDGWMDRWMDG